MQQFWIQEYDAAAVLGSKARQGSEGCQRIGIGLPLNDDVARYAEPTA